MPEIRTTLEDTPNGKIDFHTGDKVRISMDASLKGTKEKLLLPILAFMMTLTLAAMFCLMMA